MARKRVKVKEVKEKHYDGGGATRKAILTYGDVAESDDDFEAAQDKILLDGHLRDQRHGRDHVEASDEEVLALSGVDSDSNSDSVIDDGDEAEGWGNSKREYYNTDEITDEEDLKAEEEEALRIQKRNLSKLSAADYVDDVSTWKDVVEDVTPTIEELPTSVSKDLPQSELVKILEVRNPEFKTFANEFTRLHKVLDHLHLLSRGKGHPQEELIRIKYDALRSYLAVLAFYFTLISSPEFAPGKIKEHEIMISLIRCREAWNHVDQIFLNEDAEVQVNSVIPESIIDHAQDIEAASANKKRKREDKVPDKDGKKVVSFKPESDNDLEEELKAVEQLTKKKKKNKKTMGAISDHADDVIDQIGAEDAADRRKSLQFQASRSKNRHTKRTVVASGDQDLPYQERRKEREKRMQREAEVRKGGEGDDLDNEEPALPNGDHTAPDSDEEYYQLIASKSKATKEQRKQEHDDAVALMRAERSGYAIPEHLSANGKRAIGRDIAANKGLTTKKRKENRNARVKKRNNYEAAKKKLASKKAIFKQPTGSYTGEASGINTRVVKSVRLDGGSKHKR